MSKRYIGLDKWRLGKLEDDYKKHKKTKKGLGYLMDQKVRNRSKKKFPCKRLKGEHNFILIKSEYSKWWKNALFKYYECDACGKQDLQIKSQEK